MTEQLTDRDLSNLEANIGKCERIKSMVTLTPRVARELWRVYLLSQLSLVRHPASEDKRTLLDLVK